MKLLQHYTNFMDRLLPVGGIIRKFPYAIVFKTTHWCTLRCAHCCENAGNFQPKKLIPAQTIKNYISQAKHDAQFDNNVVFTGGEIMSSYIWGNDKYLPELLDFCQNHGIRTDIKTNASWVNAEFAPHAFDDLSDVIQNGKPYNLQISLSLDRYHTRCVQNCAKFIHELSRRPGRAIIHISSFKNDTYLFNDLIWELKNNGTNIETAVIISDGKEYIKNIVEHRMILNCSTGELFDGGRAKNIAGAYHTPAPQFSFMTSDMHVLMAFDSFGRVTLGENSGRKINTKWCDKSGKVRTLTDIRRRLICSGQFEDIRYHILKGKPFFKQK